MGEIYNSGAWAAVGHVDGQAGATWAALASQANVTARGPGLSQGEAVQVALELAALRDLCAAWGFARVAAFPKPGATVDPAQPRYVETHGLEELNATADRMAKAGLDATFVVGLAPFIEVPNALPVPSWGRLLALALDGLMVTIGTAEQGPAEQARVTPGFLPAAVIPLVVIVTGAALSIIGTVATWRYLDPDVRRDGLVIRQAATDYAQRLVVYQQSGTMPPPSTLETGALETVQRLAAARATTDWTWAAVVAGGVTVGTLVLGIVANRRAA